MTTTVNARYTAAVAFLKANLSAAMPTPLRTITEDPIDLNLVDKNTLYLECNEWDYPESNSRVTNLAVNFHFALFKQNSKQWADSLCAFALSNPKLGGASVLFKINNASQLKFDTDSEKYYLKIETDILI